MTRAADHRVGSRVSERSRLAAALRALADRVDDLDAAHLVGELAALTFTVWTASVSAPTEPSSTARGGPMLNTPEAARLLGISATALRRLVAAGEVPVCRFGRRVLYRRETLDRLRVDRERQGGH
jgi:excisionase family DNA binding protein